MHDLKSILNGDNHAATIRKPFDVLPKGRFLSHLLKRKILNVRTFLGILAWFFVGAAGAFIAAYVGCELYYWAFPVTNVTESIAEQRGLVQFVLLMFSPWVGIVTAASYAAIRFRRRHRSN